MTTPCYLCHDVGREGSKRLNHPELVYEHPSHLDSFDALEPPRTSVRAPCAAGGSRPPGQFRVGSGWFHHGAAGGSRPAGSVPVRSG